MKLSRRAIWLLVLFATMLTAWLLRAPLTRVQSGDKETLAARSKSTNEISSQAAGKDEDPIDIRQGQWQTFFATPIEFFGLVVDDKGKPVVGARTFFTISTPSLAGGPTESGNPTDAGGRFQVTGKRGSSIVVWVEHPAYHKTANSLAKVSYATADENPNAARMPLPSRDKPTVFVLKKRGDAQNLVHLKEIRAKLPMNGTPVVINLESGQNTSGSASLTIALVSSAGELPKNTFRAFPWSVKISAPGGGIVERLDSLSFEAPEDGYLPELVFERDPNSENERWTSVIRKGLFVRFASGVFARVRIEVSGEKGRIIAESFLNPAPGNRNLEPKAGKEISR